MSRCTPLKTSISIVAAWLSASWAAMPAASLERCAALMYWARIEEASPRRAENWCGSERSAAGHLNIIYVFLRPRVTVRPPKKYIYFLLIFAASSSRGYA